ncbi:hypothetical protein [Pontibacter sp. G13]|uniref:hypothetical protein n=1 Tax=Pontibacter sp. G13 TaxID=3074898 RepID=UPI0028898BC3|nr:hypothetical protein [Pontibacter sp. G13]WNJ19543.1 hypothetical protein RJD25_03545 [Pontibacter sp. G13]
MKMLIVILGCLLGMAYCQEGLAQSTGTTLQVAITPTLSSRSPARAPKKKTAQKTPAKQTQQAPTTTRCRQQTAQRPKSAKIRET